MIALSKGTGDSMSMAEKRSDYSDENYQPSSKEAGDPLAELARLIGQSDPFNDGARTAVRKPADILRSGDRPAPEWLARPAAPTESDYDQQHAPRDAYRGDASYQQHDDDQPEAAAHDDRDAHVGAERYAAHAAHEQDHQYDDRYRVAPPPAGDYDGDHYYAEDGHMPPQQGEENVPNRRRGALLTVAAVVGLAVIGTAGAFGYRAFTSGPGGSANPPVIKADTGPAKIVPPTAPSADAQSKPFQERVGAASVVMPREEQPVSLPVPPQPRPSAPQNAFPPTGGVASAGTAAAPPPSMPPAGFTEPKRVRTQTIRPEAMNDPAPVAQPPASSGARTNPIAPQSEPAQPRTKTAARTPVPTAGSYAVQVSAQKSEAEAQSSYRALQQKYPAVLGGRDASIRRVDLGDKGGIFYRAQVGSFATMEQANTLCNNLKEIGGQCIVQRN